MGLTWGNVRSLVIFFGPILIPKGLAYYRSIRNARARANLPIVAVPAQVQRVLFLLACVTLFLLIQSTPFFAPENVFQTTQSRLQIPVDVLFTRLRSLRPGDALTATDEALRAKFVNLESRLLYLQYGPDVVAGCPFCGADDPRAYFYYALPSLLAPHVLNLQVLAAATSRVVSGAHGPPWRSRMTLAAVAVALLDLWLLQSYDPRPNAAALRIGEIDFFFWSARAVRLVALAGLDAVLATLLYLSSTNRAFPTGAGNPAVRVESLNRALALVRRKISALGIVRNAAVRDDALRARSAVYWADEVRLMTEIMEEREVVEGINEAIGSGRVNVEQIEQDAEAYAKAALQPAVVKEEAPVTMVG